MNDQIIDEDRPPLSHDGRERRPEPEQQEWERSVLGSVVTDVVRERRAARRWGIFFKLLTLAYVVGITGLLLGWWGNSPLKQMAGNDLAVTEPAAGEKSAGHTAVIDVLGVIKSDGDNSAARINRALREAFANQQTKGVILRINSPGGSPVQSNLIFNEIKRLREKHTEIPVYAVVEEICASGGYYVAAAADKIFVDGASLVGSIGVLINGFGFVETMHKLGVERRLFTAGTNKGFLDPFSPIDESERDHMQTLLADIHQQFISAVKTGRGDRLKDADESKLFSGLVWTGAQSVTNGLADGLGSVSAVARDEIKHEKLVRFGRKKRLIERIADQFGLSLGRAVIKPIEDVGTWQIR